MESRNRTPKPLLSRRRWRWPFKAGIAVVVTTLVLFPRVDLLVRNIGHWARLDELIEPDAPGLAALESRVRERLAISPPEGEPGAASTARPVDAALVLATTQAVVEDAIPYAWDWETWGVADYVPRVEETLAKGREDCDGRAVVAASLLRRMGHDARLVSDMGHVWVWTPSGQTMSPGELAGGEAFVRQGEHGSEVNLLAVFNLRAIVFDWARNLAYGVAVFPAWREAVLVLLIWGLVLGRRPRWNGAVLGLAVLVAGWWVLRLGGADYWNPRIGLVWLGFGMVAVGVVGAWASRLRVGPPLSGQEA
ncbi:MAG: hypothetical protein KDA05_09565 [Phycisphaerales bacterium]|nr:hypothetical protein [Phycisphaerales bacterium]